MPDETLETRVPLSCSAVSFSWPDGGRVFTDLDLTIGEGRTGLVGANGAGKSTLLRLLAGELQPTSGRVDVEGTPGYLPQDLTLAADLQVADVLGVAEVRAALAAIESGRVDEHTLAVVSDRWDVEESSRATLDRLGLDHVDLDRRTGTLSGGELVLLGLAAQLLRRPDVLLLDEPTNNLDLHARRTVYETVRTWRGTLVVVSHDRALLGMVDRIADLHDHAVRWYGGNLAAYEDAVAAEQEAAARSVRAAESDVRRQKRELAEARVKLDRRLRYGKKMWDNKREPKAVMQERRRQAEVSAGKHRIMHTEKLAEARERLTDAEDAVADDDTIRVELPETSVPSTRDVLRLAGVQLRHGPELSLHVRGPERIALVGANGSGKTTLLRTITGTVEPASGEVRRLVPVRYLPQRLDVLDDELSVAQNVARLAPGASDNAIRAKLARFLFRGDRADMVAGGLSGGERFRASLAALLLAEPAPQLFLLDEPTNNLDFASVEQLTEALQAYTGALVVASHDLQFLRTIDATRWLSLADELTDIDPQ